MFRGMRNPSIVCQRIAVAFAAAAMCLALQAPEVQARPWWQRGAEGWFWYHDPPAPVEKTEEKQPEPPAAPPVAATPPAAQDSGSAPLSVAWLREHLPRYLDRAVDDPSPDNVRTYLLLQRVAMDRASRFSDVASQVVTGDPLLDEHADFPTGTRIAQDMQRQGQALADAMLSELAGSVGLAFFYRADCPYCAMQVGVLRTLSHLHGFEILPISLDGRRMPGNPFPAYRTDRGEAAQLGITRTPALVLMRPPDGMEPVAYGLVALAELKERMLLAAARRGWIDPARYQETRPAATRTVDVLELDAERRRIQQRIEVLNHAPVSTE